MPLDVVHTVRAVAVARHLANNPTSLLGMGAPALAVAERCAVASH
jgi:hypothetical protein